MFLEKLGDLMRTPLYGASRKVDFRRRGPQRKEIMCTEARILRDGNEVSFEVTFEEDKMR